MPLCCANWAYLRNQKCHDHEKRFLQKIRPGEFFGKSTRNIRPRANYFGGEFYGKTRYLLYAITIGIWTASICWGGTNREKRKFRSTKREYIQFSPYTGLGVIPEFAHIPDREFQSRAETAHSMFCT